MQIRRLIVIFDFDRGLPPPLLPSFIKFFVRFANVCCYSVYLIINRVEGKDVHSESCLLNNNKKKKNECLLSAFERCLWTWINNVISLDIDSCTQASLECTSDFTDELFILHIIKIILCCHYLFTFCYGFFSTSIYYFI